MITPIEKMRAISPMAPEQKTAPAVSGGSSMFGAVFQNAIENVRVTDAEKTEAEYLLATGQLDNPAALTIAAAKNQIAVDLLVQMRNKALEAYSELDSHQYVI